MPSDITGTEILEDDRTTGSRSFKFVKGRSSPTSFSPTRSTARLPRRSGAPPSDAGIAGDGRRPTYDLPRPFFVLATQNPIEQEGTYPLPEAQLDRFMFDIRITYPKPEEELQIALSTTSDQDVQVSKVLTGPEIEQLQQIVRRLPVSDHVGRYAVNLARATRPDDESAPGFTKEYVGWGAGTRAVQYLVLGAKARAAIAGEYNVTCAHVQGGGGAVLRHRVMVNFHGEAEGVSSDRIVADLLKHVSEPRPEDYQ